MNKRIFGCLLAGMIAVQTMAQESSTLSPYSQYGLGVLADQSLGFSRGMAGVGIGLRNGHQINMQNPASYSAVDSLTMLFDLGLSGKITNFKEGGRRVNAKTATFEIVKSYFIDSNPNDEANHGREVAWMVTSGISTGWEVSNGYEFRGLKDVTRCDFATFLYRLADLADNGRRDDSIALSNAKVKSVLATVSDCDARTSHADEVAWLVNSGISKGWTNQGGKTVSFRPMAKVARQDMAAFLLQCVHQ